MQTQPLQDDRTELFNSIGINTSDLLSRDQMTKDELLPLLHEIIDTAMSSLKKPSPMAHDGLIRSLNGIVASRCGVGNVKLSEIAKNHDVTKSTVRRHLKKLEELGVLMGNCWVQDETGEYCWQVVSPVLLNRLLESAPAMASNIVYLDDWR